jgi:hypothetical protein
MEEEKKEECQHEWTAPAIEKISKSFDVIIIIATVCKKCGKIKIEEKEY